jgi:glucose-specific phosphotransferase system IIA component
MNSNKLTLLAPVSGVIYPLERVPDPVFSQKLAGDGISIDPTDNILRAPCPGEIIQQHAAGHAVTLKAAGDVEVLMHVGIDTVALKGKGFTSRVKIGDKVDTGAPLIEFDLDYVATNAKSLLTEVIISNGERVSNTVGEVFQVRHVEIQVKEEAAHPTRSGDCSMTPSIRPLVSLKLCAHSFMAIRNKPRPPFSPRIPSCSRIPI